MVSDEVIVNGCVEGKREFQRILYDRFASKMLYVCFRYCRNREEAEDVLQDGFIKVFGNISKFRSEGSVEGWIRRIMVNTSLEFLRKKKTLPKIVDIETASFDSTSDLSSNSKVNVKDLNAIIEKLPPGYNLVFNLFVVEGYSHKEIAEILGISEGTSKSQLSKAKATLKELMQNYFDVEMVTENHLK